MLIVTLEMLRKAGACSEERDLFVEKFGEDAKVRVTRRTVLAVADLFDWQWAIHDLLPECGLHGRIVDKAIADRNRALRRYYHETRPANKIWSAKRQGAEAVYRSATKDIQDACHKKIDDLYRRARCGELSEDYVIRKSKELFKKFNKETRGPREIMNAARDAAWEDYFKVEKAARSRRDRAWALIFWRATLELNS